jgi:3-hydroxymyristoyl/3-hydroxydecanoyl-(acyl carrier protein) dehydratase
MKLPAVRDLARDGDAVRMRLSIPAELDAFQGHFPGEPILPGVVQVDWAVRFAAEHFATAPAAGDFQVKFRQLVRPDHDLALLLTLDGQRRHVAFEYRVGDDIVSSGKFKLGSRP